MYFFRLYSVFLQSTAGMSNTRLILLWPEATNINGQLIVKIIIQFSFPVTTMFKRGIFSTCYFSILSSDKLQSNEYY